MANPSLNRRRSAPGGRNEFSAGERGAAVAALLAGGWRLTPPPLHLDPATLEAIQPLLAVGGAGGLAWHRLRHTSLRTCPAAREFRQHYRLQTLHAGHREEAVRALFPRLRAAGVEPLLIKGWTSARLYPEVGLRPSCDIDLCVAADRVSRAATVLSAAPLPAAVDLHEGIPDLPDRRWEDVFGRSRLVDLEGVEVRVLGPEDQLRLLCLHLARHGVARPLWLCDVGACLDSLPADFDWEAWQRGHPSLTGWANCVLALAGRLLDARTEKVTCPPWVQRAVLWCWGNALGRPLGYYLRHPGEGVRRLRYHGISPNHGSTPIKAALQLGLGPAPRLPLLLVQLLAFLRRKVPHTFKRLVIPRHRPRLPFTLHRH